MNSFNLKYPKFSSNYKICVSRKIHQQNKTNFKKQTFTKNYLIMKIKLINLIFKLAKFNQNIKNRKAKRKL